MTIGMFALLVSWLVGSMFLVWTDRLLALLYIIILSFIFSSLISFLININLSLVVIGLLFDVVIVWVVSEDILKELKNSKY